MKKLFLLTIIAILYCGCAVFNYSSSESVVDFRNYTNRGFFITPLPTIQIDKEVTTIGIVKVTLDNIYEGYGRVNSDCKTAITQDKATLSVLQAFDIKEYDVYDYAIARLVNKVIQLGGNGITDFHISFSQDKYNTGRIIAKGCAVNIK